MLLPEMEKHVALVYAALVDGRNFRGYQQEYANRVVEDEVMRLFHIDLKTPEGLDAMFDLATLSNGRQLRYHTVDVGKKLHSAIILYLLTH